MTDFAAAPWTVVVERPDIGFRWGRAGEDYVAEWAGILSVRAGADGTVKEITPAPGAPGEAVEKIRRGAAAAFLRALEGKHSYHASAVAFRGSALLCVGPSGAGKSTIAARLCDYEGVELLADDVAGLDRFDGRWHARPSESWLWLTTALSGESKRRAAARRTSVELVPVRWVVVLRFDEASRTPNLRRLNGAHAGSVLLEASVHFHPSPRQLCVALDVAEGLASQAEIYELARARSVAADGVADRLTRVMDEKGALESP